MQALNHLIDAADALLPPLSSDEAWLKSVELVEKAGGNALNVVEIERTTGIPIWFRSSMKTQWLEDYFAQGFISSDPLILSACQGHLTTRMVNGRVQGFDHTSERARACSDQMTSWGYQTLDYHVYATSNEQTFKGLAISHGYDRPKPSTDEKLV